jgi:hypothetical protein
MAKRYIHRTVGRLELRALTTLAEAEEAAFFERNPHLTRPYRRRLIAIALCQGAALQYLGRGYGVNDFDLHFFYSQNPQKPRLTRAHKRIVANVGSFQNVPVDFLRTVVPSSVAISKRVGPVEIVRAFLQQRPTPNARHLAAKAVVGLLPEKTFGVVIWRPDDRT